MGYHVQGCDFFRKYTDTHERIRTCRNPYFQMLVFVFRWHLMLMSCLLCDFVGPQIRRYADMQIGVPAFSLLPIDACLLVNSLTPKSVPAGTKNSHLEGFWLAKNTRTQTSSPWWSRFPLQRHGFDGRAFTTPGSPRGRGWTRPSSKGFSWINILKEKIIYFYHLSNNYNNRSPAVGNDSLQNSIHCCQRAAIIKEIT